MKSENLDQKIGILGGLGPLACVEFQKILFDQFKKKYQPKSDQDYPEVIAIHATKTPDRPAYILDQTKPDPTPYLQKALSDLESLGCNLIVIPCNTAHYFLDRLVTKPETVIVNIIQKAALVCKEKGYKAPLLLATSGTISSRIYERFFQEQDINLTIPSSSDIDDTMDLIYNGRYGIKAGNINDANQNRLAGIAARYDKADCVILGCTELPLVSKKITYPTIDPMVAAADFLIDCVKKF